MRSVLVRVAVPLAVVGLMTAGCGSESTEPTTQTEETPATVAEETSPQTPAGQAAGGDCPTETAVTVTSTNGGYEQGLDWSGVQAVAERRAAGLGGDGTAVVVYISNHERAVSELSDRKVRLEPGEAFLKLNFTNGAQDAEAGDYTPSADPRDHPNAVELRVWVTGASTNKTVSLADATGDAQLAQAGDKVCGTFDLSDKWTQASGTFVADMAE